MHAWLPLGTRDLPGPGFEPVYPVLTGGFLTTQPPRKPKRGLPTLHFSSRPKGPIFSLRPSALPIRSKDSHWNTWTYFLNLGKLELPSSCVTFRVSPTDKDRFSVPIVSAAPVLRAPKSDSF